MDGLFTKIRSYADSSLQDVNYIGSWIGSRFTEQIENATKGINDLDADRKKLADKKAESYDDKEWDFSDFFDEVSNIVLDSYDELYDTLDKCQDAFIYVKGEWSDSLDREGDWYQKSGLFESTDYLLSQTKSAIDKYNTIVSIELPSCDSYKNEYRKDLMERLAKILGYAQNKFNESDSQDRESLETEYNTYQEHLKSLKAYKKELESKKKDIVNLFLNCCSQALSARRQYVNSLPTIGQ